MVVSYYMLHLLDHEGVSQPDSPLGGTLAFSQSRTGIVHEGAFPSVEAAMRALGITRSMRTCLFRTLDMSPQEMERVLNERY